MKIAKNDSSYTNELLDYEVSKTTILPRVSTDSIGYTGILSVDPPVRLLHSDS